MNEIIGQLEDVLDAAKKGDLSHLVLIAACDKQRLVCFTGESSALTGMVYTILQKLTALSFQDMFPPPSSP